MRCSAEGQDIPQTLKATIAEHGETLRPDVVVRNPEGVPDAGKPRLLVQIYPPTQNLEKPITGRHWKASPATRMMELLHATDVRLGLVTNGEHWMLVDAPKGETTGFASWYATLWLEEPLTLRAFRSLLGVQPVLLGGGRRDAGGDAQGQRLEPAGSHRPAGLSGPRGRRGDHPVARPDRPGREAATAGGRARGRTLRAALTVMMRLVFLFSAEERGLLLLGDPLYDEHYAVSTLVARLQEAADQHGEEVLERRHDAWVRLLSTFRAVYGGVQHERLKLLPYAGNLFDPDRFPFLEGRKPGTTWKDTPATPLPIDNRTVLHLLRSLQYLEMHGEARRLSFRALDIEQIGHVYEGLLDHTAKRATEPMLSLTAAKGDEPEVALSELERLQAKGEAELLKFLKEQTGRVENALDEGAGDPEGGRRGQEAAGRLRQRRRPVQPGAALLGAGPERHVRLARGDPQGPRLRHGGDRPALQRHALHAPQPDRADRPVHAGAAGLHRPRRGQAEGGVEAPTGQGTARPQDLRHGVRLGAFLVQACRYLSERLVEAWEDAEKRHPGVPGITPEGTASTGAANEQLIPKDTDERLAYARRIVAQRCLYGVDKNPLAVEMAKLSLWLLTLAKDKPFTFLDHAIRCGDSLVGVSIRAVEYILARRPGIGITLTGASST